MGYGSNARSLSHHMQLDRQNPARKEEAADDGGAGQTVRPPTRAMGQANGHANADAARRPSVRPSVRRRDMTCMMMHAQAKRQTPGLWLIVRWLCSCNQPACLTPRSPVGNTLTCGGCRQTTDAARPDGRVACTHGVTMAFTFH